MSNNPSHTTQLANYLIKHRLLSPSILEETIIQANQKKISLINLIVRKKILPGKILAQCCSTIFQLPMMTLKNHTNNPEIATLLPFKFMQHFNVIPLKKNQHILDIGIVDPSDASITNSVIFYTGLNIKKFIINYDEIFLWFNQQIHSDEYQTKKLSQLIPAIDFTNESNTTIDTYEEDQPLIQLVNNIILNAQQKSASDIHIEPNENNCRIRYRQQGVLQIIDELPKHLAARITTRLKVLAKLDIAEKRLPQDGRFHLNQIDLRINTCPTLEGEKIVLRLLNTDQRNLSIDELNMDFSTLNLFKQILSYPQGMILVTGPTGSGKTVTLYAALNYLNHPEKNISTIEDPVEIRLPGINQINIHHRIDLNFAKILRALLRQDPDIIMLGEIRDTETAEIAIQAAQTGHLVLSTLHTNSALDTLSRLKTMQVPIHHLTHSIKLIIAQRLIRIVCANCRVIDSMPHDLYQSFRLTQQDIIYRANGCEACTNGFQGRTAIYEFLPITEEIITGLEKNMNQQDLLSIARKNGFITLLESGIKKIQTGMTTLSELKRVLTMPLTISHSHAHI